MAAVNSENCHVNFNPKTLNVRPENAAAFAVALEPEFDFAGAGYRALQANSRATVFQSPAWLDGLHREVAPAFRAEQVTVTARDQTGRLMMVLPLVRRRQRGIRIMEFTDFGLCDYNAAVCDLDYEPLLG